MNHTAGKRISKSVIHPSDKPYFLFLPKDGKIVFKCNHGNNPKYVAEANGQVHLVTCSEEEDAVERRPFRTLLRNCCVARSKCCGERKIDMGAVVNKCCRVMYPGTFLLFNFIYWLALWFG